MESQDHKDITMSVSARIAFKAGEEAVRRFSELTGDVSSLHTDESFARRSAYRRPVVHGMFPLAFLPVLPPFRQSGRMWVPTALSGRFSAPVFFGDGLDLVIDPGQPEPDGDEVTFAYRVERGNQGETMTTGEIRLVYREPTALPLAGESGEGGSLLDAPLSLQSFGLEEIETGMKDHLDFCVSPSAMRSYLRLLEEAFPDEGEDLLGEVETGFHLPNLLAILLFSTSLGVCMPGATATFLEFSARLSRELERNQRYRLLGTVSHRSRATTIVRKAMRIDLGSEDDQPLLEGKVSSLVNKPSARMPSMAELRDSGLDPGLVGRVALVTGASRGIGETIAKYLSLSGVRVVVNYHRGAEDAARVVDEIRSEGGEAMAIQADITDQGAVRQMVKEAVEQFGGINILVNNAARDFRPIPFLDLSWDEIQKDLDVCARGAFLCAQKVIPHMLDTGGGKIVNISTLATDLPPPNQAKYVIAKSALVGLTRSLAMEFASRNIQVNMVVPNFVETDLVAHVQEGFRRKIAKEIPMQRLGSSIDVARAVAYLSSAHSSFTTGQKIMVTGGAVPLL
jgi:3-oxoacyl-[acyl-carrier protein] reductase